MLLGVTGLAGMSLPAVAEPASVLLSVSPDGSEGVGSYAASAPSLSRDGAHVAFASAAANLVEGDTNGAVDVFVRDRGEDGTWHTTLVSASALGAPGNGDSYSPSISADGREVAFASEASNLDGGGGAGKPDVFVWHRDTRLVDRISRNLLGGLANGGSYAPSISADGNVVAFASDAADLVTGDLNDLTDVFVWTQDPTTGLASLLRVANRLLGEPRGSSYQPSISANGRVVAFASEAPNLVEGDDNDTIDVFVHDRATGTTTLVSKGRDGTAADGPSFFPAASSKGDRVAFVSMAADIGAADGAQPNVYLHDVDAGATTLVSEGAAGEPADSSSFSPAISANGRYVAFDSAAGNLVGGDADDGGEDVFVRDTAARTTTMVPLGGAGGIGDQGLYPGISPDGAYVAFAVVPPDWSTCQYYLYGPMQGAGTPDEVPPAQETSTSDTTTTTTTSDTTTTTEAAPTGTSAAVTETTGG